MVKLIRNAVWPAILFPPGRKHEGLKNTRTSMTWMLTNWVERRASREQHLANAAEVWRKAQTAVAHASDSLRRHYSAVATIRIVKQSTDELVLAVSRSASPGSTERGPEVGSCLISLKFFPKGPQIMLTSNRGRQERFPIEADCDHAYLSLQGRELLYDEFSRLVLEDSFFSLSGVTLAAATKRDPAAVLEYVNELVRTLDSEREDTRAEPTNNRGNERGAA